MQARHVLVRRPGPRLRDGLVTHIERCGIDTDLALRQWYGYVEVFQSNGWTVTEAPPADGCPDAVFVEDTVVVYADLAVLARPGADSRRPEVDGVEQVLRRHDYRIARIAAPGTLDGGDVLKHGGTVWVGTGGRTNAEGLQQLRHMLAPLGAHTVGVPVGERVLHLKSAVTALPDGTVLGYPDHVADRHRWRDAFLAVPEPAGAHVVILDDATVLIAASAPQTADLLRRRGLRVLSTAITEFEKLEGCVTCLSVRLRGRPA